jgi:hypothetical protein
VDDYTAWTVDPSGAANRATLQCIVDGAVQPGFEPDKTAFIHFMRMVGRSDSEPLVVEGEPVAGETRSRVNGHGLSHTGLTQPKLQADPGWTDSLFPSSSQ